MQPLVINQVITDQYAFYQGDCVQVMRGLPSNSVGLCIFSPPFPGMYCYSNSARDMGNVASLDEMIAHFGFLIPELLRVTLPGRSCCIHLTQAVAFKNADDYIGLKDFRGRVIAAMEAGGWVYYGEAVIPKNPQLKAIRTHDRGLLFKSLATDSSVMHMALNDYLLQFVKPGANAVPIRAGRSAKYNNPDGWITSEEWIAWASGVWTGINETRVLNVVQAKEQGDEKHLCPLQLDVIERAVKLWTNPGDLVCSPYAGIGSEGFEALRWNRRFVGIELKPSYWQAGRKNLGRAVLAKPQPQLWDLLPDADTTPDETEDADA